MCPHVYVDVCAPVLLVACVYAWWRSEVDNGCLPELVVVMFSGRVSSQNPQLLNLAGLADQQALRILPSVGILETGCTTHFLCGIKLGSHCTD